MLTGVLFPTFQEASLFCVVPSA